MSDKRYLSNSTTFKGGTRQKRSKNSPEDLKVAQDNLEVTQNTQEVAQDNLKIARESRLQDVLLSLS